jgi:hypothetical protein
MIGAGLSCGLAVVSGIGVLGGAAAEVPTAGASTVIVVLAWTGFVTSGIQCVNGVVRAAEAIHNPASNSLQQWDTNKIYSTSILIVDAVGVVSGLASLPFATRNLLAVLERRGGMVTAERLAAMSRAERPAAIQRAVGEATRTPEGRQALEAALRDAGLTERQAAQVLAHGAGTARRAGIVARVISQETARRLNGSLRDAIGTVAGAAASATPESLFGSASGSVNALIVHITSRD